MRIGVDSGGTFTDVVIVSESGITIRKVASTPDDPARAIIHALEKMRADEIIHGSTVATNALLERKHSRAGFITQAGFLDILDLGRQSRPDLHALEPEKQKPLIPAEDRFEVQGRIGAGGKRLKPLDLSELSMARHWSLKGGFEAIAVGLLHSTENKEDEEAIRAVLADLDLPVVLSSEVAAEPREWERFTTATAAAVLTPVMKGYLERLAEQVYPAVLRVMDSSGSARPWQHLAAEPVKTVLSGPAGGVVAATMIGAAEASELSKEEELQPCITFDMGGTSTDVCLVGAEARSYQRRSTMIDGLPLAVPMLDVHTVGAGGGSLAWIDPGGALRVGPQSAGAEPGPAAYGKGGREPTVTDAHVVLGRLPADAQLGEQGGLDVDAAKKALEPLAGSLGWSIEKTALGMIEVVNHEMERAIRKVSQERGQDPAATTLISFGGAGALHAVALAQACGIPKVRVPAGAGVYSALGLLMAPWCEQAESVLLKDIPSDWDKDLEEMAQELEQLALSKMSGASSDGVKIDRFLRARHLGQSHDLEFQPGPHPVEDFRRIYEEQFGYRMPDRDVEGVAMRVTVTKERDPEEYRIEECDRPAVKTPVCISEDLGFMSVSRKGQGLVSPGEFLEGPILIEGWTTFSWLPLGVKATVDRRGDLIIDMARQ
ncbi:MAG: hydantoinase/oxoprolinase family protein [Proteobacteria bacterium]|nr:hydantoinase/oxoprolinase family protein [Verrucomicrobiaceae bacterium]NCG12437.1 hydantoinase/oxoprolinase family protein [Planctomycetia bacterium]NCG56883.1 hydantoinase/oxoprolinase family protein [Pseudomonadota bacterium]